MSINNKFSNSKPHFVFLGFSLLFLFPAFAQGQSEYLIGGKSLPEIQAFKAPNTSSQESIIFYDLAIESTAESAANFGRLPHISSLSETYWKELGFFCKIEIKMEQKTRFPVKFRLGTVDYVDYLEGKSGGLERQ